MNAMPLLLREEPPPFRISPSINPATAPPPKVRVVVLGSFHGGYHVLRQCLREPLASRVTVTTVMDRKWAAGAETARKRMLNRHADPPGESGNRVANRPKQVHCWGAGTVLWFFTPAVWQSRAERASIVLTKPVGQM